MRRFFLFVLVLYVSPCLVMAFGAPIRTAHSSDAVMQERPASPAAKSEEAGKTEDTAAPVAAARPDYSKEPFVIEQLRVHSRFESDGTGRTERVVRVRVQSEGGLQRWGQLRFGYNSASESLEIKHVRVIKRDGSVVLAGSDSVQELAEPIERNAPVYTDHREKHVTVPGLRPGDVLEYETVAVTHTPLAPGQFWTQYEFQKSDIVLDERFEIDVPAARTVKLKTRPGLEPKITEENGRRIYRWSSSHLLQGDEDKTKDTLNNKKKKSGEACMPHRC